MTPQLAFSRREQKSFFVLLAIFCLAYFYELANFNVSIDDEFLALADICNFAGLGRWLHPLVRKVFWPQVVVPTGPLILFGVAMAASFIYVLRMFDVKRPTATHYVIFAAFALYPAWPTQLEFSGNIVPVAIGLLAAVLAAWLLQLDGGSRWALGARAAAAALLLAVAVGAYQSLSLLFLVFAFSGALWQLVNAGHGRLGPAALGKRVGLSLGVFVGGTLLSLVFAKLTMMACQAQTSAYADSFFHPEALLNRPLSLLALALSEGGRLFWGYWRDFGHAKVIFALAILVSGAVCVGAVRKQLKLAVLVALVAIFLVPTGFVFIIGKGLPIRAYFAAAAVLGCFLLLAHSLARGSTARTIVLALAALAAVQGLYINSIQQARGWSVQKHDFALASAIYQEAARRQGPQDGPEILLNIAGARPFKSIYPAVTTGTQGASFFEWDGGNFGRMLSYMHLIGYTNVNVLAEETPGEFAAALADMPAWPAEGSMRRIRNGYLVKL